MTGTSVPAVPESGIKGFSLDKLREDAKVLDGLSFDQVWDAVQGESLDAAQLGEGFEVLDRAGKDSLTGVSFLIFEWQFNDGDYGEFVSLRLLDKNGRKAILNDGSTGICQQMRDLPPNFTGAILCRRGLRRSDYTFEVLGPDGNPVLDSKGEPVRKAAATYYLDTSV
jgi:hypothetical protein